MNSLLPGIVEIDENEILRISVVIAGIGDLLEQISPRTLANYAMWRVILDSVSYTLNEGLSSSWLNLLFAMHGVGKYPPRLVFV